MGYRMRALDNTVKRVAWGCRECAAANHSQDRASTLATTHAPMQGSEYGAVHLAPPRGGTDKGRVAPHLFGL